MLVHLLRSNPHVLCHGEVFGATAVGQVCGVYAARRKADRKYDALFWKYRTQRLEAFLYDVVFDTQNRRVAGFKFKTDEAFAPEYKDVFDLIHRDTDIKIIHLRRRNLLDQYVSHQVVLNQTGVMLVTDGDALPQVSPFAIDVSHLLAYVSDVLGRERLARELYANHRQAVVNYEDMIQENHPVRDRLQVFLGLHPVPLATRTRKIIERNSDLVLNMDEVVEALTRHGFEDRLLATSVS